MRQPSIVIHKGRKEEKYELYVEDYVISFLKEKKDMPDAGEILFYGCRAKGGRQYTIYGAGLDRHLAVFDKYDLLEEIGCRLTHADPVFLVSEGKNTYEIKGYKVFYYENEEMQDYLIHQDRKQNEKASFNGTYSTVGRDIPDMPRHLVKRPAGQNPHYLISLQLGLVFVVLVAIVINSANSYDKMEQLNQSAEEVFFVMENQETEEYPEAEEVRNDIVVEWDMSEHNMLRDNVLQENEMQGQKNPEADMAENQPGTEEGEEPAVSRTETEEGKEQAASSEITEAQKEGSLPEERVAEEPTDAAEGADAEEQAADASPEAEADTKAEGQEPAAAEEGVEALSRNVARYYEVERGDTLYMISKKIYGDTAHVKRICEINQITDPDNICYGQKIILP